MAEVNGTRTEKNLLIAFAGRENDYNLNLMLGLCYKEKGRKYQSEAITHLAQARNLLQLLDRTPKNIPHQQLAELYNKTSEYQKAIETSNEGLRLARSSSAKAGLTCTKAKGMEGKGKYEDALELFESIIDDPTWGRYAQKQIERQENLILRKAAQEQG